METNPNQVLGPVISRLGDAMIHINPYSSKGNSRLASAVGTDPSTISRLIRGKLTNPSFALIARITTALEKEVGHHIDPRDLFAEMGAYLTRHICEVMRCRGCLPPSAHDEFNDVKPSFARLQRGQWVSSRFPNGYPTSKEAHD